MKIRSKYLLTTLSLLIGLNTAFSQDMKITGSVSSTGLNYTGSATKDNGYLISGYGYLGIGLTNSLELGVEYTHIKYKDGLGNLDQNDLTLVYTNYSFPKTKIRMGFHYIDSDDVETDGGYTIILGLGKYETYAWDANIDFYYSYYKDYILADGSKGLSVYQITPSFGFGIGNYYDLGRFYFKSTASYIRHSDDVGFGKNFFSLGQSVTYYKGKFSASIFGWIGKRSFFVDNGGFTVYNLKEKYKYGYGASISYGITDRIGVSLTFSQQKFDEEVLVSTTGTTQTLPFPMPKFKQVGTYTYAVSNDVKVSTTTLSVNVLF
jgi:hypothetical protein